MAKHQKSAAGAGAPDASGAGEMPADVAGMRYEAALQELESIIQRIEEGPASGTVLTTTGATESTVGVASVWANKLVVSAAIIASAATTFFM